MRDFFIVSLDLGLSDYKSIEDSYLVINGGPKQIRHLQSAVLLNRADVVPFIISATGIITDHAGEFTNCIAGLDQTVNELTAIVIEHDFTNKPRIEYSITSTNAKLTVLIENVNELDTEKQEPTHTVIIDYSGSDEEDYVCLTVDELSNGSKVAEFLSTVIDEYDLRHRVVPDYTYYENLVVALFSDRRTHEGCTNFTIYLDNDETLDVILEPSDYSHRHTEEPLPPISKNIH